MYVTPKTDCPHVSSTSYMDIESFKKIEFGAKNCNNCDEKSENWICLTCGDFYCSRYVKSHFLEHYNTNKTHAIGLGIMDISLWCYECDAYIVDKELSKYERALSDYKFGGGFRPTVDTVTSMMGHLNIEPEKVSNIKYHNFIELLKSGKFKKISFMTGAGISTTAGIPDFRSNDSGLFKQLQDKYKLDTPEQFFEIGTFKKSPELFYEFAKEFDISKYIATPTHMLNLIFTQNIDSLEFKANLPEDKVVFAHGNLLEAHCSGCDKEYDREALQLNIKNGEILYCKDEECKHPIKPKVIFYGEKLPKSFFMKHDEFNQSDLGIIMGTSLKVMPFNFLPYQLNKNTWRIVVNRERVGQENELGFKYDKIFSNDLFLEGSTDETVLKILDDCGWRTEFDKYVEDNSK